MSDDDASEVQSALADFFPEKRDDPLDIRSAVSLNYHIRVENKLKCARLFDHYAKSIRG
jgi:hypothetical protein